MNRLIKEYEKETGEKALYRRKSSDYHTLKYVKWLENKIIELEDCIAPLFEMKGDKTYEIRKIKED